MSTQFGGGTGGGAGDRGKKSRETDAACHADDLRSLIERIAEQMSDADQRQSAALEQMLARVEALGAEARSYKTRVPEEFLPAFERIEDGVTLLADRIASTHSARMEAGSVAPARTAAEPAQPKPPTVAAPAQPAAPPAQPKPQAVAAPAPATPKAPAPTVAVAAHAIDPVMANDEDAWDPNSADALAAHYEEQLGELASDIDDYTLSADYPVEFDSPTPRARTYAAAAPVFTGDVKALLEDGEKAWLEQRFVEIAHRLEDSFAQVGADPRLSRLGERFDKLEKNFGNAMHDIATRQDVEALHVLETHIAELANQFEETRSQLGRLDSIEHSLAAVIDRLTDPRFDMALDRQSSEEPDLELLISSAVEQISERIYSTQPATPDMHSLAADIASQLRGSQPQMPDLRGLAEGIADAAAERVASRFAEFAPGRGEHGGEDVSAIRQLLDQFINERREGEEQTAAMLDTMQRAIIRMLDRVDALELSHSKPGAGDYPRYGAEAAPRPVDNAQMAPKAGKPADPSHGRQTAYEAGDREPAPRAYAEPPQVRTAPPPPPQPRQPGPPAAIERLRQDFIADARRAKEKAASTAAPAAEAIAAASKLRAAPANGAVGDPAAPASGVKLGKPRTPVVADESEKSSSLIGRIRKPPRKLLVTAIVLMIAIPGVLMLMKKGRGTSGMPTTIEQSAKPAAREIAPVKPAVAEKEPETQSTLVPTNAAPEAVDPKAAGMTSRPPKLPAAERGEPVDDASKSGAATKQGAVSREDAAPVDGEATKPVAPKDSAPVPPGRDAKAAPQQVPPVVDKSDLYRTNPQTQTRGLHQQIEVPVDAKPSDSSMSVVPLTPITSNAPPAGITVATPRRMPTLAQLESLSDRQAQAQLSNQLGAAQVDAIPAAMIPEFMHGETASPASPEAPKIAASISDSHRRPLDLPPAMVGPLSLRMAAAKGDPSAEFAVAARFADGTGVQQDLGEAMRWYQRSAARGFSQSQYRVATFYERGLGVTQDIARAKIWYQRAAESGNIKAMHNLAVLSAGKTAKVPDYASASRWFKAAAEHGLADSQFNLAVLYESGLGVTKDAKDAYFWFALAARSGDGEAARRQKELEQAMEPADVANVAQQLATWRPKPGDRIANDPLTASEAWKARASAEGAI